MKTNLNKLIARVTRYASRHCTVQLEQDLLALCRAAEQPKKKTSMKLYAVLTNGEIGMFGEDVCETRHAAMQQLKYLRRTFNSPAALRAQARELGVKHGKKTTFTVVKLGVIS